MERKEPFIPVLTSISKAVEEALSGRKHLNFGLLFNKWMKVKEEKNHSLSFSFVAKVVKEDLLDKYAFCKPSIKTRLDAQHKLRMDFFQEMKRSGFQQYCFKARAKTSLILGLGNAHPSERGFTLHWTLGIPYIPAESIKGVVRLAFLIERARKDPSFFDHWAAQDDDYWMAVREIFGAQEHGSHGAYRGKVMFLDALPLDVPELMVEIATPHYRDYYKGERGPTEDQHPVPLPFLAVKPGTEFLFCCLFKDLSPQAQRELEQAFQYAILEHGLGAKTSLGHGVFEVVRK